jgi:hypothetical protein
MSHPVIDVAEKISRELGIAVSYRIAKKLKTSAKSVSQSSSKFSARRKGSKPLRAARKTRSKHA